MCPEKARIISVPIETLSKTFAKTDMFSSLVHTQSIAWEVIGWFLLKTRDTRQSQLSLLFRGVSGGFSCGSPTALCSRADSLFSLSPNSCKPLGPWLRMSCTPASLLSCLEYLQAVPTNETIFFQQLTKGHLNFPCTWFHCQVLLVCSKSLMLPFPLTPFLFFSERQWGTAHNHLL